MVLGNGFKGSSALQNGEFAEWVKGGIDHQARYLTGEELIA
jgi:hypothetical protein